MSRKYNVTKRYFVQVKDAFITSPWPTNSLLVGFVHPTTLVRTAQFDSFEWGILCLNMLIPQIPNYHVVMAYWTRACWWCSVVLVFVWSCSFELEYGYVRDREMLLKDWSHSVSSPITGRIVKFIYSYNVIIPGNYAHIQKARRAFVNLQHLCGAHKAFSRFPACSN